LLNYGFAYSDNPYDYCEVKQRGTKWKFYFKAHECNEDMLASIRNSGKKTVDSNELLII